MPGVTYYAKMYAPFTGRITGLESYCNLKLKEDGSDDLIPESCKIDVPASKSCDCLYEGEEYKDYECGCGSESSEDHPSTSGWVNPVDLNAPKWTIAQLRVNSYINGAWIWVKQASSVNAPFDSEMWISLYLDYYPLGTVKLIHLNTRNDWPTGHTYWWTVQRGKGLWLGNIADKTGCNCPSDYPKDHLHMERKDIGAVGYRTGLCCCHCLRKGSDWIYQWKVPPQNITQQRAPN